MRPPYVKSCSFVGFEATTTTTVITTGATLGSSCVRNTDCSANAWCNDLSYDAWCASRNDDCPPPQCVNGNSAGSTTTTTSAAGPTTVPGQLPDPVITITQTDANQLEATALAAKEQITSLGELVKQLLAPGSFESVDDLLPVIANATPPVVSMDETQPVRLEAPPPGVSVDEIQPVRLEAPPSLEAEENSPAA